MKHHPKEGDNATNLQEATGSEKERKVFRRNRKPKSKQETRDKTLLYKKLGRSVNQMIGEPINFYWGKKKS